MGNTQDLLNEVRAQLAPSDEALDEARKRRAIVTDAALGFPGSLRAFNSGSLAHKTANCPIHHRDRGLDADCGVVLDRRRYPQLGPDGSNLGPNEIVQLMLSDITGKVRVEYPQARLKVTKRAILIEPRSPLSTGEDPTVDLIVALDRHLAPGLWIPNTEQRRWDASDPEEHTRLLTAEPKALRVTRAQSIRLAKAENKRTDTVPLCSFNLEALALMFVHQGQGLPRALLALWQDGAADLRRRLTPDPANVSGPINVEDRSYAAERLEFAAARLQAAISHDYDDARVRSELQQLWPEFIAASDGLMSKAQIAASQIGGAGIAWPSVGSSGGLTVAGATEVPRVRSFGDARR
jgi:hypothetical protein